MTLKINDTAPNFDAETTIGKINFYDWAGDSWVVLFSHPKNFTPVCTTELGALESVKTEFDKRKSHEGVTWPGEFEEDWKVNRSESDWWKKIKSVNRNHEDW